MFKKFKDLNPDIKKRVITISISLIAVVLLVIGISYAYIELQGKESNLINAGCLKLSLTEGDNINLVGAVPIEDSEGETSDPYTFTIENTCTLDAEYNVTLNVLDTSTLANTSKTKVFLEGDADIASTLMSSLTETTLTDPPVNVIKTYLLDTGVIAVGETKTYDLRLWIDYDATSYPGTFDTKIIVDAINYEEKPPEPTDEMCFDYRLIVSGDLTTYPALTSANIGDTMITNYKCGVGNTFSMPEITDVVIPTKIDGKDVVVIENTTTTAGTGQKAFCLKGLTSVVLPNTLIVIGRYAFRDNKLTGTLTIPASVTIIERYAFYGTYSIANGFTNKIQTLIFAPGSQLQTIGNDAFRGNNLTGTLTIPASVTSIENSAFSGSGTTNQIETLIFAPGSQLQTIGADAFYSNQLTGTLTLPNQLISIYDNAFDVNNLTKIIISTNVTNIGWCAFAMNRDLTNIVNTTGRAFYWGIVLECMEDYAYFVTGTYYGSRKNISITAS